MSKCVRILAPAKVNLALAVGPLNAECGLHPIASWMRTVDFSDQLELKKLPEGSFSRFATVWSEYAPRPTEIDWPLARDLAFRAHQAVEAHAGRSLPVQSLLTKEIPVGSGLGGGSSNAAAMLRGLDALFELSLGRETLITIAASLGSDVPFFLQGGDAVVSGFGEQCVSTHCERFPALVLVFPATACPTGEIFDAFDEQEAQDFAPERLDGVLQGSDLDGDDLFNDLLVAAETVEPDLVECRTALRPLAERTVHLTGSGSTLFIPADNTMHAEALATAIEDRLGLKARVVSAVGLPQVEMDCS